MARQPYQPTAGSYSAGKKKKKDEARTLWGKGGAFRDWGCGDLYLEGSREANAPSVLARNPKEENLRSNDDFYL